MWLLAASVALNTSPQLLERAAGPTLQAVEEAGNRAVVRYSGTEPKLRILVEGMGTGGASPDAQVAAIAAEFAERLARR